MRRHTLLSFLALAVTFAVVACGGGSKKDSAASAADSQTSPSSAASTSANPPGASLEQVDLSESLASLSSLKSFRFDMSMKIDLSGGQNSSSPGDDLSAALSGLLGAFGDIKASGSVVAPDQVDVKATILGHDIGYVQIGLKAWQRLGDKWEVTEPSSENFDLQPSDFFNGVLPDQLLSAAKTSTETVNGVKTTRYSFDKSALQQVMDQFDPQTDFSTIDKASLDIWLNADQIPVKISMNFAGQSPDGQQVSVQLDMNIKNINDPSIKIVPPV